VRGFVALETDDICDRGSVSSGRERGTMYRGA